MTDLEKIELALRRIAERERDSHPKLSISYWLTELADQIARDEAARRKRPTIEELDRILNSTEGDLEITVNPDGSISAKESPVAKEH